MNDEIMKIFISHAKEDSEIAERLYNDLKKAGASTWINDKDLLVGQNKKLIIHESQEERFFCSESEIRIGVKAMRY